MSSLQANIETIIKENIQTMTGKRQQKRSLHIAHQYHELLCELFDTSKDAILFVNHFGHIEYQNSAFSKLLMLDKLVQPFNNIYNMDQQTMDIDQVDGIYIITYPSGLVKHISLTHQVVHFQKSTLLQISFKDIGELHKTKAALMDHKALAHHYLDHLTTPMFLVDREGFITHSPLNHLKVFDKNIEQLIGESVFEVLPFDYANQVMGKIKNITTKVHGHFMYQTEKDKVVKVYDTTVIMLSPDLYLCQLADVSDLNTMSSTLEYLNAYDSLTGFYNATYYETLLLKLKDSGHLPMGIYGLSLQGLKNVNLRLGRHHCDNLIIEIALHIKSALSQHEIPCRITGDTFIVFFPNCSPTTMDKFIHKMADHIHSYKATYGNYYINYVEKNILVNDSTSDIDTLVMWMIV